MAKLLIKTAGKTKKKRITDDLQIADKSPKKVKSNNDRKGGSVQSKQRNNNGGVSEPDDDAGLHTQGNLFSTPTEKREAFGEVYGTVVKAAPTQTIKSAVDSISSAEDVAHLLASIRKDPQEAFYAISTDKDGKILRVSRHTKGLKGSSSVDPLTVVSEAAGIEGIAEIHYAHNHPTGNVTESMADVAITEKLNKFLDGMDITAGYHVIVAGSNWTQVSSSGKYNKDESGAHWIKPRSRTKSIAISERKMFKRGTLGPEIHHSGDAVSFVQDKSDGLVLLNKQNEPVALLDLTKEEMSNLRESGRVQRILAAIDKSNASKAIIRGYDESTINNLARMLGEKDVRVIDGLKSKNNLKSMADDGTIQESGVFFSKKAKVGNSKPKGVSTENVEIIQKAFFKKYKGADDVFGKCQSFCVCCNSWRNGNCSRGCRRCALYPKSN